MVDNGADIDVEDDDERTALMHALQNEHDDGHDFILGEKAQGESNCR